MAMATLRMEEQSAAVLEADIIVPSNFLIASEQNALPNRKSV